jgi:hypothetical protein
MCLVDLDPLELERSADEVADRLVVVHHEDVVLPNHDHPLV